MSVHVVGSLMTDLCEFESKFTFISPSLLTSHLIKYPSPGPVSFTSFSSFFPSSTEI